MVLQPGPHVVCGFYLDYECAWSLLGGAGVLASPFQAMHGLASPLTAAYGSASVGGRLISIILPTLPLPPSPPHTRLPVKNQRAKRDSRCFSFLFDFLNIFFFFEFLYFPHQPIPRQPIQPNHTKLFVFLFWLGKYSDGDGDFVCLLSLHFNTLTLKTKQRHV